MPEKPVSAGRRITEGVAIKVIAATVLFAGGAAVTFLAGYSAYFSGRPFYQVAPFVAVVFSVLAIGILVLLRCLERLQTYLTEHRLAWLNKIAERDRLRIDQAVPIVECQFSREAGAPGQTYIEFMFDFFNGSVYSVTIDKTLTGFIRFGDLPLQGRVAVTGQHRLDLLEPRQSGTFVVTLWLSQEDTETIEGVRKIHAKPSFGFDQLLITVAGANEADNVIAQPLNTTNVRARHP